jgi:hypothetical protein
MMEEAEMLKKVVRHSVATALASSVLPVPGGPYSRMPFHGLRIPVHRRGGQRAKQLLYPTPIHPKGCIHLVSPMTKLMGADKQQ